MYACGLRISEAAGLSVTAIDRARMVVRVIGKGDKERLVPLPQPVLADLEALWRTHRNPTWLFPNRTGRGPVSPGVLIRSFAGIVNLLGESRGLASLTANRGAVGYAASLMPQTSCHAWKARARSAR
jgi:site-specific recombinase XerD